MYTVFIPAYLVQPQRKLKSGYSLRKSHFISLTLTWDGITPEELILSIATAAV